MTPSDLAIELDLDRAEATLDPTWLRSPAAAHLATRASRSAEPALRLRGTTLHRWILAAFLGPHTGPRTLAGLAARHAALADLAARLGLTPRALATAIHGRIPDGGQVPICNPADQAENHGSYPQEPVPTIGRIPDAAGLMAAVAAAHGLETAGIERRVGQASETVVRGAGHARMTIGNARDGLAGLAVEMHEAGHALYRAQQAGRSVLAAAPPARWFDEAIAAWAVRAIEEERFVADEGVRRAAAARRVQREVLTRKLAAFEEVAIGEGAERLIEAAWQRTGLRDPAAYPALFDEPGVMASYVAADRARLQPAPGELRAWARAGAALELRGVGAR